jgi:hypothetical protein
VSGTQDGPVGSLKSMFDRQLTLTAHYKMIFEDTYSARPEAVVKRNNTRIFDQRPGR